MAAEEEYAGRRQGTRAKSLPIGAAAGTLRSAASATTGPAAEEHEPSVAVEATRGFIGGVLAGAQMKLEDRLAIPEQGERAERAPVRDADGRSLADLAARGPGEDPLPGTAQPLVVDALDAVQRTSMGQRPKGAGRAVVMHPDHIAGLKALEGRQDEGLESDRGRFGR